MDSLSPSSFPIVSSLASTFFLFLAFASSPLIPRIALVEWDERLPDGTTGTSSIGLWGGCTSKGSCKFASPFASQSSSLTSSQTLSAILPSQGWTVILFGALALALVSSTVQHLLHSYQLYRNLSRTPRVVRKGTSRVSKWSKSVGRVGALGCLSFTLILSGSLLAPYYQLVHEYLDPDGLGGQEIDGGCLASPGVGSLLVALAGLLMLLGGNVSDGSSKISLSSLKDLADEEEEVESPTTGAFMMWTETRTEKPWVVLDVLLEEDEEVVVEERYQQNTKRSRSRSPGSPVVFFLA